MNKEVIDEFDETFDENLSQENQNEDIFDEESDESEETLEDLMQDIGEKGEQTSESVDKTINNSQQTEEQRTNKSKGDSNELITTKTISYTKRIRWCDTRVYNNNTLCKCVKFFYTCILFISVYLSLFKTK